MKMLVFDMDGTLGATYDVPNWLEKLRAEDTSPYEQAEPMWDMTTLTELLADFRAKGGMVAIITWLSMGSTQQYKERTRQAKIEWLEKYNFPYDEFHGVQYGTTKADSIRRKIKDKDTAILFDDSEKVRKGWHLGETVDPTTEDIIKYIKNLLGRN